MKNKILFVANIHKHFMAFHLPYIIWLKGQGYEVHVAANDASTLIEDADKQFIIPISRKPFSFENIKATIALKRIIKQEQYCLVHCHTAMGSVTARIAAKSFRGNGLKVLYTAHGFHFYKGSPRLYWLLYYPVEKYLSKFTDVIITINKEDFELVQKKEFRNKFSFLLPGVGVKNEKFNQVDDHIKLALREKNNLKNDDFILIYAAEYIYRKNHKFLIEAIPSLIKKIPNLKVLLAGRGELMQEVKKEVQDLKLQKTLLQLGFRTDIDELYKLADVGISTSRQEGLGLNLAEEMMCGLPVVASLDRGHKEIIDHSINGFLFEQNDKNQFEEYILYLFQNLKIRLEMSLQAKIKSQKFELENSLKEMQKIYKQFLDI